MRLPIFSNGKSHTSIVTDIRDLEWTWMAKWPLLFIILPKVLRKCSQSHHMVYNDIREDSQGSYNFSPKSLFIPTRAISAFRSQTITNRHTDRCDWTYFHAALARRQIQVEVNYEIAYWLMNAVKRCICADTARWAMNEATNDSVADQLQEQR